ncbi:MAG: hypothetical protein IAE78_28010 [Myxococcus sp.]|nr:hypothetical protein [Myxococcus sp.]
MTTRKTTRSTTTAAPKKAATKKPASMGAARTATKSKTAQVFALQLGTGFSLLTQQVDGGAVTVTRVPAGATLKVSYWKEPTHPAHPKAKLTRITMHVRLDGELLPTLVVAQRDDADRLVRLAPTLVIPAEGKLFEYWFELETDANETLWDSNWGHNHWLELTERSAATPGNGESAHAEA